MNTFKEATKHGCPKCTNKIRTISWCYEYKDYNYHYNIFGTKTKIYTGEIIPERITWMCTRCSHQTYSHPADAK